MHSFWKLVFLEPQESAFPVDVIKNKADILLLGILKNICNFEELTLYQMKIL